MSLSIQPVLSSRVYGRVSEQPIQQEAAPSFRGIKHDIINLKSNKKVKMTLAGVMLTALSAVVTFLGMESLLNTEKDPEVIKMIDNQLNCKNIENYKNKMDKTLPEYHKYTKAQNQMNDQNRHLISKKVDEALDEMGVSVSKLEASRIKFAMLKRLKEEDNIFDINEDVIRSVVASLNATNV